MVLARGKDYVDPRGKRYACWECKCSCGNIVTVRGSGLKSGRTKSCGCLKTELNQMTKFKNQFDLSGEYGIGYTGDTHREFMFDMDDYEKIKGYYWNEDNNGYVVACMNKKKILMHRYILDIEDSKIHVDHRYHDTMDNRKENLRPTSCHNNTMNEKIAKNNTSGVTGVSWEEKSKKWHSYIWYNGKTIHLGRFTDFKEAVEQRKKAENRYFGEFSYSNSMKENI